MSEINKLNKRTKAAAVLILVTILLLISNYFIGLNSKKTNETIKAIYNDRLIVSHYIFQYNNAIHQIKENTIQNSLKDLDKQVFVSNRLQYISKLDKKYLATVLTAEEKTQFKAFQNQCTAIQTRIQSKNWQEINQLSEQSLKTLAVWLKFKLTKEKQNLP
ncbi:MAG: MCP four helix bundle domain-containing protein [Bacteroidota bacterium]